MSSLTFTRYLINCDGCEVIFGDQQGFSSLTEARAVAYSAGWRFPNRLNTKGVPANATSDVCPKCIGKWEAPTGRKVASYQRALTLAEVALLPRPEGGQP